ncbi:mechanosensitive ion channel family protein [Ruania halotolerans]|uniref:mechanosensitive ion channel family protein n=1 Tax=Ruania halotolerans TaxID=2897773 RepID=UPI001E3E38B3|nr:mechanosensitive ion channel domain-containing protein [Ruania halotolerans]UFU05589.1 mechanosensitive ion channel family protein [Ruania halotolerans]
MEVWHVLRWVVAVAASAAAVIAVVIIANLVVVRIGRRVPAVARAWRGVRRPLTALVLATALRISFSQTAEAGTFRDIGLHVLLIAVIVAAVWLVETVVLAWLAHLQVEAVQRKVDDDRGRRRIETQMRLIQRVVGVAFVIIGIALVLLTFPGVEQIGAAVLASAGLLSVVLGIAAQTSLGNLFAGLQLAFTDAIRIGDVVEVDGTWSTIEDITLSYVVVSIWDERHKVLPSTYFTTTPFINWSRTGDTVTGTVYFSLDWRVDLTRMRAAFEEIVDESGLWDGRARSILVTDSSGDRLTVRALVTSVNTDADWTLRCYVREHLATWLREHNPEALPIQRVVLGDPAQRREQQ